MLCRHVISRHDSPHAQTGAAQSIQRYEKRWTLSEVVCPGDEIHPSAEEWGVEHPAEGPEVQRGPKHAANPCARQMALSATGQVPGCDHVLAGCWRAHHRDRGL